MAPARLRAARSGRRRRPQPHLDHARNIRIIEEKLPSFQIPASVTATNTGPVVTQYEVRPDAHIKLSRIEALADDLAMALAARSIRIEAPIPGRDVVGIEIPNHSSEIVAFRQVLDDAGMSEATSKLTFALGRDVSGKAYAVDLARMPHLLIAGATGSGKSVCVNALITSILMRATPDEVRLDPDRPQARRACRVPRPAAPRDAGDRRVARGARRADQPRARHGGALRAAGQRHGAQHRRLQRQPAAHRQADAVHGRGHRRAGRPDPARRPQGRGSDRQDRPEGARGGHPPRPRHAAAERQRRDRPDQGQRSRRASPSRWPPTSTRAPCSTRPARRT